LPYLVPLLAACTIAAVAAVIWALRRPAATPAAEIHRTAVTRLPGREIQPAISPDGKRIAFVWEEEGGRNGGIWVQSGSSDQPRRITPADGAYSSPAWSPDGQYLACVRFQGSTGSLIVLPVAGGPAREAGSVMPPPYGLANRFLDWSPDGASLVFADAATPHGTLSLYTLSFATGARRRLTQPGPDLIGDVAPRFSPDGKTVSFVRAFHRSWQELFSVPYLGGTERQLTAFAGQISGHDWFDNGASLVFGSDKSGEFRLWTMPAAGPPRKARPTSIYGDFPVQLSVARRTQALAYSVLHHDLNIWRLDLQAKPGSASQWTRIIASSAQDVSPQYSPDGRRICFRSDRSGEEQLWVSDSDGGNQLQVTQGKLHPSVGRWAPDSRAIVFNNARTGDLFVAREVQHGGWATQPLDANGYHPVYSPDGKWIYAGTKGIDRIPAQGGPASQIATVRGLSLGASTDGSALYFVREPSGSVLWRLDLRSSEAKPVLDGLVPYCTSCWALAARGLYYLGSHPESDARQTLYFHDAATRRDRAVVDYPEPLPPIGTGPFSLSPDGRYLLCVRLGPPSGDVFRVDPFP
jgi:Tol biopolymer transport system component